MSIMKINNIGHFKILFLVCIATLFGGCTRNNGDIGDLFGIWRLESITADGEEIEFLEGETRALTWSFQSHIILIRTIYDYNESGGFFGTWTKENSVLILNFTHEIESGAGGFRPPTVLHLNPDGITTLSIHTLTSRHLDVSHVNTDGKEYRYKFKKVP